jgi:hypothetical protein
VQPSDGWTVCLPRARPLNATRATVRFAREPLTMTPAGTVSLGSAFLAMRVKSRVVTQWSVKFGLERVPAWRKGEVCARVRRGNPPQPLPSAESLRGQTQKNGNCSQAGASMRSVTDCTYSVAPGAQKSLWVSPRRVWLYVQVLRPPGLVSSTSAIEIRQCAPASLPLGRTSKVP